MPGVHGYVAVYIHESRRQKHKHHAIYYGYNYLLSTVFFMLDILLYGCDECHCYIGSDYFSMFGISFFAIDRKNMIAVIPISIFTVCHLIYGIVNYIIWDTFGFKNWRIVVCRFCKFQFSPSFIIAEGEQNPWPHPLQEKSPSSQAVRMASGRRLPKPSGTRARVNSISPGWIDTAYRVYEEPDATQQPAGRVGNIFIQVTSKRG